MEVAGATVGGRAVEALEADRMIPEVEVAEVNVEACLSDDLWALEAATGGRKVDVVAAGVLSRVVDAAEAARMSLDMEVAEVTIEARRVEALESREAVDGGRAADVLVLVPVRRGREWVEEDS